MKKLATLMLAAGLLISMNSFAAGGDKKCKKDDKCSSEKSCCKKPAKAAMLKAKSKAEIKKVA